MNAAEVEALLFRIDVTYPGRDWSREERVARVAEWLDSRLGVIPADVADEAWRDWKNQRDRPPTPHQFAETCHSVRLRRALDTPRPAVESATPEERERILDAVREARPKIVRDETPTGRHSSGALVHRPWSRRWLGS